MLNMDLIWREKKMCKYEGCNKIAGGKKKLYCGNQNDWGTCAYYRNKEAAAARQKDRKKGIARTIYNKICVYCNEPLATKRHNQMAHGGQDDKKSCSYLWLKTCQQKYKAGLKKPMRAAK